MLRCASCGSDNDQARKFCIECGERLLAACLRCGSRNPPSARFCGECGAPQPAAEALPPNAPTRVAERRLVSVLFADLVGFTAASEARDPEETRELLSRYFETARRTIQRYGGTVEKFIGDAVMAVWGAPLATEDDAERAVRAALELVDQVAHLDGPVPLQLRAGVLTGEAAVTLGVPGEGMVAGDLVNTASRLQAAAAPGSVLVGEATHRSTRDAIAYELLGEQELKGKALPVRAWRALQVIAARRGAGRASEMEPPFVGRETELRQLKDLLEATPRDGRARLVSIIGQPGIGKTRLALELRRHADGLAEPIFWHQGRSPAYGEGITFWALSEMIRQRAGLTETDDAVTTTARIGAMLAEYVPDQAERSWIAPYVRALLGAQETPSGEPAQQFAAWRTLFERIAERGLLVMVLEDLQWADPGLIEFIESVLEWSRSHPILVITLARPELVDRHPSWGAAQRNATLLRLEPLNAATMTELLRGLIPGVPDEALRRIVQRAGGIPLYAVETVRMLLDGGGLVPEGERYRLAQSIEELDVPDSLHALVAARLDTLDPADRGLIQDAAVLGQTFTLPALAALTDGDAGQLEPRLRSLIRRELLVLDTDPRSTDPGHYAFIQGVVREVAYETLARRDRRARHLAAARYHESVGGEEVIGPLANHYLEAYRAVPQGSEGAAIAAQARVALRAAAERAAALHSHEQATAYLERALTVTDVAAERAALLDRAAAAAVAAGLDEAAERFLHGAIELHREGGDTAGRALSEAHLGALFLNSHRIREAIDRLHVALEELGGLGSREDEAAPRDRDADGEPRDPDPTSDPALARLTAELARGHALNEDAGAALGIADRALTMAAWTGDVATVAEALTTRGIALEMLGRHHESIAVLLGATRIAERHGLVGTQLRATFNLAARIGIDDPGESYRIAREGVELAKRSGLRHWLASLTQLAAGWAIGSGDWEWAMSQIAELREGPPLAERAALDSSEAVIAAYRGRFGDAERLLADAERALGEVTDSGLVAMMRTSTAEVAVAAGDFERAYEYLIAIPEMSRFLASMGYSWAARAAALARDLQRYRVAVDGLQSVPPLGRMDQEFRLLVDPISAALSGDADAAVAPLHRAAAFLDEAGQQFDAALMRLLAVRVLGPGHPYSGEAAAAAREVFERLGAKAALSRLDEALAGEPANARDPGAA